MLLASAPAAAQTGMVTLSGFFSNDWFGVCVASAGDVNGDGYADVIVGASYSDDPATELPDVGRAYVYFGGPVIDPQPDLILTGQASGDQFARSVDEAGDFNGDGFGDLVIGAYGNDALGNNAGRVYIFYGGITPDATPDVILSGSAAGHEYGRSVAGAGDMNGDGYDDIVAGAPGFSRAFIVFGASTSTNGGVLLLGPTGEGFGWTVAGAGDLLNDGYPDVLVGAPFYSALGSEAGRVHIYFGGPIVNNVVDGWLNGTTGQQLGWAVGCGDVNGDSSSDVLAGGSSVTLIYHGGTTMDNAYDRLLPSTERGVFGHSLSGVDDINQDGFDDVVVGNDLAGPEPGSYEGRADVFHGGDPMASTPALTLRGPIWSRFGLSVSGAGDMNGDGRPEIIIGAPHENNGVGRAYIYDFAEFVVSVPESAEPHSGLRAWPNPASPGDRIRITLTARGAGAPGGLDVGVFDVQGRRVADLGSGPVGSNGTFTFVWQSSSSTSGLFLVRARDPSTGFEASTRLVVMR